MFVIGQIFLQRPVAHEPVACALEPANVLNVFCTLQQKFDAAGDLAASTFGALHITSLLGLRRASSALRLNRLPCRILLLRCALRESNHNCSGQFVVPALLLFVEGDPENSHAQWERS